MPSANNDTNQKVIISVGADTSDLDEAIDASKQKIKDFGKTPIPTDSFKSYKQAIKEATNEAQKLEQQFGRNSKQFIEAAKNVAELKDKMQEYTQTVEAFNPDNKLQAVVGLAKGVTGALQGIGGAISFIGGESAKNEEIIRRLQGLMSFSQALNSIDDIKNSYQNFKAVLGITTVTQEANTIAVQANTAAQTGNAVATEAAGVATISFGTALKAIGIGLVIAAIVLLITKWDDLKEAIVGTKQATVDLDKINQKAISSYVQERDKVGDLVKEAQNELTSKQRKKELIKELNDISPNYFKGIKDETDLTDKLTIAANKYNRALLITNQIKAARTLMEEDEGKLVKLEIDRYNALTGAEHIGDLRTRFAATNKTGVQSDGTSINTIVALQKQLQTLDGASKEAGDIRNQIDKLTAGLSVNDKSTLKTINDNVKSINNGFDTQEADLRKKLQPYNSFIDNLQNELIGLGGNPNDTKKPDATKPAGNALESFTKQLEAYFDKVQGIYDNANREIVKGNLNARDAEIAVVNEATKQRLSDLDKQTADELKALEDAKKKKVITEKQYQDSILKISTEFNTAKTAINEAGTQQVLEVNKKYDKQINDYLNSTSDKELDTYSRKKKEINDKIDELLLVATDAEKTLLESSRTTQLAGVDKEQGLQSISDAANQNLIGVQNDNVIGERDTPKQRYDKTMAVNQAKIDAEQASFELQKVQLANNNEELAKLNASHNQKLIDLDRDAAQAKKALDDETTKAKLDNLETIGKAAGTLGDLVGQQTVAGKALAVAQATVDTYAGATKAFAQGGTFGFVSGAAIILAGLNNVKKILSVQVPAKNGSSISAPALPVAPSLTATQANPVSVQDVRVVNQGDNVVKAYISNKDLAANEQRNNFLNRYSSF